FPRTLIIVLVKCFSSIWFAISLTWKFMMLFIPTFLSDLIWQTTLCPKFMHLLINSSDDHQLSKTIQRFIPFGTFNGSIISSKAISSFVLKFTHSSLFLKYILALWGMNNPFDWITDVTKLLPQ